MNKGKICLFLALAILLLSLTFVMLKGNDSEDITLNGSTKAHTEENQFPSESTHTVHINVQETTEKAEDNPVVKTSDFVTVESEKNENIVENNNLAVKVQPEGDETLPPEVDAIMGVEKDEELKDIDDLIPDNSGSSAQATKPTEPEPTEPKPTETTPTARPSTGSTTDPLSDNYDLTTLTYEGYIAMTGEQQQAVIDWFSSPDMFIKWFNLVEARYKEAHPDIEIGSDGVVDLS